MSKDLNYFKNQLIPIVSDKGAYGERMYDIFSRLLKDRVVFLGLPIDNNVANVIMAQLLLLDSENKHKDIFLYINSPGGIVSSALAIYDTMQYIKPDISTICVGQAASAATLLLSAGANGKRCILPNSRVMIHQIMGGIQGQATDIDIQTKEMMKVKDQINKILAKHTGRTVSQIEHDSDRNYFMSAKESLEYGLVDKIIT